MFHTDVVKVVKNCWIFSIQPAFFWIWIIKRIIKWHNQGCLLKRITKIIFWNLLRANTVNICYIESFGVLLKKMKNWWFLILIFSYEAVKYQKVSVCIMKGLSFDFPKNNSFYLWLLEFYFFWLQKLVLKGALQILSQHLIHQKSARRSSPLTL